MGERSHRDVLRAVRKVEITTRRAVNAELAGRYHSVFKGRGMSFSEVRPYTPGDDVRHIDWNVSARHQDQGLFVKQFIEERELTVMLVIDMSASGDFGTRGQKKREVLAQIAGLIAFSAISNNDRVGLILFTNQVELFLPPRKGKKHVLRAIREIVEFAPAQKGTRIKDALAFLSRVQKKKSVCFVLSDWLDADWEQSLKLAMLRHDVVAARVTDRAELILPDLGILELEDAETGDIMIVDSSSKKVRDAYKDRQEARRIHTRRRLRQLGCDLVDIFTDADYVLPLVQFFQVRSARLRGGR